MSQKTQLHLTASIPPPPITQEHGQVSSLHPDPQIDRHQRRVARERIKRLALYDRLILLTLRFIGDGYDTFALMQLLARSKNSIARYRSLLYDVLGVNSPKQIRELIAVAGIPWTRHFITAKTGISDPYHLHPEMLLRPGKIKQDLVTNCPRR